jgi:hypothetical protein
MCVCVCAWGLGSMEEDFSPFALSFCLFLDHSKTTDHNLGIYDFVRVREGAWFQTCDSLISQERGPTPLP